MLDGVIQPSESDESDASRSEGDVSNAALVGLMESATEAEDMFG